MPLRVLVLGSSGFLGSNLVASLADSADLGIIGASRNPSVPGELHLDDYDEKSLNRILELVKPDYIINSVGMVGHLKVEENLDLSHHVNVSLPRRLGILARAREIRLVHFSSDAVYSGNPVEAPFYESSPPRPFSTYGRQKLESEQVVQEENHDALIFRINFFGWSKSAKVGMLDHFVSHALAGTQPIGYSRYSVSSMATPTVGKILRKALLQKLSGVYNLGCTDGLSKFAFGQAVFLLLGLDPNRVIPADPSIWEIEGVRERDLRMSVSSIEEQLGILVPSQLEDLREALTSLPIFLDYFGAKIDDSRRSLSGRLCQ